MILVVVGTHELPFDRLIRAAAALPRPLVVQRGTSSVEVPGAEVHDLLAPSALAEAVDRAGVVVTHGGPSTIRQVLAAGKVPIVVPRRARFGEHVDDHQLAFARRMADRVHLVEDPGGLVGAVARHREVCARLAPPSVGDGAARVAAGLEALVRALLDAG